MPLHPMDAINKAFCINSAKEMVEVYVRKARQLYFESFRLKRI